jgi:hypothetical protein
MKFLIFVILIGSNFGLSQKLLRRNTNLMLTSVISKQRMDAFWNFGIKSRVKYFEIGAEAGIGIEKTLFQQTFSPHLEIFSFYNLIQQEVTRKNGIVFGPGILLSGTTYRVKTPFNYGDIFIAYQFCLGRKWKIFHQGGYGIMFETFESNQGKIVTRAYNYCLKIGVSYAFNP